MDHIFSYFRLSRLSFYSIAYFSIFVSGPHLDATITSEIIFRRSSIDAIIYNCRPLMCMLILEDFFSRSYNLTFVLPFIVIFSQIFHNEKFQWEDPALSIGPFHKVQPKVISFPYLEKIRSRRKSPKSCCILGKIREVSGLYNFWTLVKINIPNV